jgi:hypothetical protein
MRARAAEIIDRTRSAGFWINPFGRQSAGNGDDATAEIIQVWSFDNQAFSPESHIIDNR